MEEMDLVKCVDQLVKRAESLEKENAELKRQLEERQMYLCIPLDRIIFNDPYEALKFQWVKKSSRDHIKKNLRLLESIIEPIEIG